MGRLLDGKWVTHDEGADAQGRFVRRVTQFRNQVPSEGFPVEAGRYRLFVGLACGWSHRTLLVRAMKGLEDVIPITITDPYMGENGWTIQKGVTADVLYGANKVDGNSNGNKSHNGDDNGGKKDVCIKALSELYVLAKPDYTGRASVPVLWDMKKGTIVNNESSDIVQIFAKQFDSLATRTCDILPEGMEESINEMIQVNYDAISNGVYKCGFASSQQAYTEAAVALFSRLDELELLFSRQRYLMGNDHLTLADLCLFPPIYRFDQVYHTHFKCNKKHVYEYPNLWGWARDMYQTPGVKDTCNMEQIKEHYYTSHESIHPRRYVPIGPTVDFDEPHGRDTKDYGAKKMKT